MGLCVSYKTNIRVTDILTEQNRVLLMQWKKVIHFFKPITFLEMRQVNKYSNSHIV